MSALLLRLVPLIIFLAEACLLYRSYSTAQNNWKWGILTVSNMEDMHGVTKYKMVLQGNAVDDKSSSVYLNHCTIQRL